MSRLALTGLLCAVLWTQGCGDDGPYYGVGGACRDDRDCGPGDRCEDKKAGGSCTYACRLHRDCPPGWACVNSHGGTCHLLCRNDPDCPAGFDCKKKDNEGDPGSADVCEP